MDTIFTQVLQNNFSEFNGLVIDASIPVTESLANEIIAEALAGNRELTYCRIAILPGNRVNAEIKSPRWPWPFHLKLQLFGSLDFTHSATVRAFLQNNVLLGRLGALLNALPPGVHIYEDQVSVDIESFIQDPQHRRFLNLIKSVAIKTEEQKIIFDIHMEK